VPLSLGEVEKIAGRALALDEVRGVIADVAPWVLEGSVRLLIYDVHPGEDSVCVATGISLPGREDVVLRVKCVDRGGLVSHVETLAMDYYRYVLVITSRAPPSRELEACRDMEKVAARLRRDREARGSNIHALLILSPPAAELSVNSRSALAIKELHGWYARWLATGRYTPVFLFNAMVHILRKKGMRINPAVLEAGNSPLAELLY